MISMKDCCFDQDRRVSEILYTAPFVFAVFFTALFRPCFFFTPGFFTALFVPVFFSPPDFFLPFFVPVFFSEEIKSISKQLLGLKGRHLIDIPTPATLLSSLFKHCCGGQFKSATFLFERNTDIMDGEDGQTAASQRPSMSPERGFKLNSAGDRISELGQDERLASIVDIARKHKALEGDRSRELQGSLVDQHDPEGPKSHDNSVIEVRKLVDQLENKKTVEERELQEGTGTELLEGLANRQAAEGEKLAKQKAAEETQAAMQKTIRLLNTKRDGENLQKKRAERKKINIEEVDTLYREITSLYQEIVTLKKSMESPVPVSERAERDALRCQNEENKKILQQKIDDLESLASKSKGFLYGEIRYALHTLHKVCQFMSQLQGVPGSFQVVHMTESSMNIGEIWVSKDTGNGLGIVPGSNNAFAYKVCHDVCPRSVFRAAVQLVSSGIKYKPGKDEKSGHEKIPKIPFDKMYEVIQQGHPHEAWFESDKYWRKMQADFDLETQEMFRFERWAFVMRYLHDTLRFMAHPLAGEDLREFRPVLVAQTIRKGDMNLLCMGKKILAGFRALVKAMCLRGLRE